MVGHVDAVVEQLGANILVKLAEIDALLEGLVAHGVEDAVNHLVKQGTLIHIAISYYFLHGFLSLGYRLAVTLYHESARHFSRT